MTAIYSQLGRIRFALALLALVSLCGCLRYEESWEINADGSGALTLAVSRPADDLAAPLARKLFENHFSQSSLARGLPAQIVLDYRQTQADDRLEVRAVYKFSDLSVFAAWAAGTDLPVNQLCVVREDGALHYTRRFGPFDPELKKALEPFAQSVHAVFRLNGPGQLRTHNATRTEGHIAVWEYTGLELTANPTCDLRAEYRWAAPARVWILAGAGAAALLIIAAAWLRRIRRRQRGGLS